jgi:hypothetical protein
VPNYPVRLCCLIRLCGEGEVEFGEVAGACPAGWGAGPPGIQATQIDGDGGEDVREVCLGRPR